MRNGLSRPGRLRAAGALAVSVGLTAAAATVAAAPAYADRTDDTFLSALESAGVHYGDSENAVALGKSICPALVKPGATAASTASGITGNNGMSPAMAGLFTSIAISMYCPSMVDSLADGKMPNLPGIPGVPGVPGR